jgi:hypothetical protein
LRSRKESSRTDSLVNTSPWKNEEMDIVSNLRYELLPYVTIEVEEPIRRTYPGYVAVG